LTNPALNAALLLLGPYLGAAYIPVLIALELAAVAAESAVLRLFGMKYPRALLLSAAINTLSCGAGILLWQVL
ncbi:MAG: hypothetical protein LBM78_03825, partial [Clostridiales bacterium]|nr:hypothetical protein [Clostridiales bacterium]